SGAGRLTLTGANAYAGATIVTEGTLALSGQGRLNAGTALRMNAPAVFDISAADSARAVGSIDGDGAIGRHDHRWRQPPRPGRHRPTSKPATHSATV
ncbi:MAG: autotransporter-associated beta strand repeat-containing protein, partial [Burkholderiales bacterium]